MKRLLILLLCVGALVPPAGASTAKPVTSLALIVEAEQEPQSVAEQSSLLPTFAVAAQRWLHYIEHDRRRKRSTVHGYRQCLDADLVPVFGEQRLDEITGRDVDRFREALLARGLSARSVNRILSQLQSVFTWFCDETYGLAVNPVARVRRQPQTRIGDFDVLSPSEVAALAPCRRSEQDAACSRWRRSRVCGWVSCGRCAGGTWISRAGSCMCGRTSWRASSRRRRGSGCGRCR